jgi:hypothetical protein
VHSDPWGVKLPEDMARREANRAEKERQCAQKQSKLLKGVARAIAKVRGREGGGGETPFELESSEDDEKDEDEGEIIFPHSPHPKNLPSPSELCGRQMGDPTSGRQVRRPRVEADGVCSRPS